VPALVAVVSVGAALVKAGSQVMPKPARAAATLMY